MRHPEPTEHFEVRGTGERQRIAELIMAPSAPLRAPRWLVRTADGAMWRLRLRDATLTRGPRYEGDLHWTGPRDGTGCPPATVELQQITDPHRS